METSEFKIRELETVLLELNTLKKNAKVYKQLQNSNICFRADSNALKAEVQRELKELQKEKEKAATS